LPFNLRPASSGNGPSEQKIPVRSKPLSYLRPVIVAADADGAAGTPEGDDDYYYAPAQQDFTSPISGAVQPSPPVKKTTKNLFILPSQLKPLLEQLKISAEPGGDGHSVGPATGKSY
jgi:hypothetical protein